MSCTIIKDPLTRKEFFKLLQLAGKVGVKELELMGMKVSFHEGASTRIVSEEDDEQFVNISEEEVKKSKEEVLKDAELRLKDNELAEMIMTDPAGFEKLIESGDLVDTEYFNKEQ